MRLNRVPFNFLSQRVNFHKKYLRINSAILLTLQIKLGSIYNSKIVFVINVGLISYFFLVKFRYFDF